ncbi:MAG: hypothetical protein ABEH77_10760 [Halobacteriaceae archaeon]
MRAGTGLTLLAAAVAALLVLAGCGAPAADAPATSTTTRTEETRTATATRDPAGTTTTATATAGAEAPAIAVRNGTLPADPNATFRRLRAVLGTDAPPPAYVEVVASPGALAPGSDRRRVPRFWRLLGVEPEQALTDAERRRLENGVTTGLGGIRLYPGDGDPARVEWLLAHEFVHYVQLRRGHDATLRRHLARTTDARFLARAIVEGVAVYATDAYVARHRPDAGPTSAFYERLHADLPPGSPSRYANLAYVAGHRYVAGRIDDPAAADAVYADPPATSEQLLHGTDDPPVPLRVAVATEGWRAVGSDTMGEAFLRVALENGLDPERARRAAAGWGNDSLRVFRPAGGGDPGYVWVLRFDDAADATEAERALAASLAARGNRTDGGWRVAGAPAALTRPDDRTLALAAGPAGFVNRTAVASADGGVRVSVGER